MNNQEFMDLLQEAMSFDRSKIEKSATVEDTNPEKIKSFSNEKLCSIIASNRYLKVNPKMEILCMQELADRRSRGDAFKFEEQINSYSKSFTPIEKTVPEIFEFFKKFKNE